MIHNVHMHDDASQCNPSNIRSVVGKRANCAPTPVYKKSPIEVSIEDAPFDTVMEWRKTWRRCGWWGRRLESGLSSVVPHVFRPSILSYVPL